MEEERLLNTSSAANGASSSSAGPSSSQAPPPVYAPSAPPPYYAPQGKPEPVVQAQVISYPPAAYPVQYPPAQYPASQYPPGAYPQGQYAPVPAGPPATIVVPTITEKRLSPEGWCWIIILIILFWPLAWIPCCMDSCYAEYDQFGRRVYRIDVYDH